MRRLRAVLMLFGLLIIPAVAGLPSAAAVSTNNIFSDCGSGSAGGTPSVCSSVKEQQNSDHNNSNPVIKILKAAITVISYIVGAAAIITIVVSGIRIVVSGGDSSAVAGARTGLIYALIGIAVVILSQVIVVFVLDKF